jgi:hypothetical protein
MKIYLSKYNQAFLQLNLEDEFEDENFIEENQFHGLFFLPNGNAMILFDEELIEKVISQSVTINLNQNSTNNQIFVNNSPRLNKPITQNKNSINISNRSNRSTVKFKKENEDEDKKKLNLSQNFCLELFDLIKNENNFDIQDYLKRNALLDDENLIENDLLKILNKKETSDITIIVEDIKFYAHKLILVARSKFFEIMLSQNMKENLLGEVSISNCTPQEFLLFLLVLYSDNLQLDIDIALELMKVNFYNF